MYVCMCVCLFANSSETNERIFFKITQMIDNMSGGAQKNFGDLMSKIKVSRGQKVNKGWQSVTPLSRKAILAICGYIFSWTLQTAIDLTFLPIKSPIFVWLFSIVRFQKSQDFAKFEKSNFLKSGTLAGKFLSQPPL